MAERVTYVTGHRVPDTDAIGAAIGYAELLQRTRADPGERYVAARLGDPNSQTAWALEQAGADAPEFLPHIKLRVQDVMAEALVCARTTEPLRAVGRAMAEHDQDMVPIVDADGALEGIISERTLARLYVRDSTGASEFTERPLQVDLVDDVVEGETLVHSDHEVTGRLWVIASELEHMEDLVEAGDIVVVGDRPHIQRRAMELGCELLVTSNGARPSEEVLELARQGHHNVVVSPLDSYVVGRMVSLSVACQALMSREPLTVTPDDVLADIVAQLAEVDYQAAIAVDPHGIPVGVVDQTSLVNQQPRRVILVDHAERAQSVPGIEEADIVEILDHHAIGSIETRLPLQATFDPVGSTATLVTERFRAAVEEPTKPTATMLLAAALSDTVVLSSPTTTPRDHVVVAYLEQLLGLEAEAFGRAMFEASSDVSGLTADEIVGRDIKAFALTSGKTGRVAQIETVGDTLLRTRGDDLRDALERRRARGDDLFAALMVTDIVAKGTVLLVAGDVPAVARAFHAEARDGALDLPGVMSRKKQIVPRILTLG